MKELYDLKMKAMEELKEQAREIGKKGRMSTGDLDSTYKLTKLYDKLCDLIENEEGGYSETGYSRDGTWRANMEGDYSRGYSNRRRDSRGRYTRDGQDYSMRGYSRDGYSMSGDLMEQMEEKMRRAKTDYERDAIRRCMDVMKEG